MDGLVIIDKPKGLTSHDVVQRVKRIFSAKKAGHTGTLDPIATGVLPVCLNKATKLSNQFMAGDKEYEVEILLGTSTDTFDTEGEIVETNEVDESLLKNLDNIIDEFRGDILQKPPYFSAVKHKGKPLYRWAREGKFIDLPPRQVTVKAFDIIDVKDGKIYARIRCSKGTYIRSICHDLGQKLGIGACMSGLRRTETGGFRIDKSIKLIDLEGLESVDELVGKIHPL